MDRLTIQDFYFKMRCSLFGLNSFRGKVKGADAVKEDVDIQKGSAYFC